MRRVRGGGGLTLLAAVGVMWCLSETAPMALAASGGAARTTAGSPNRQTSSQALPSSFITTTTSSSSNSSSSSGVPPDRNEDGTLNAATWFRVNKATWNMYKATPGVQGWDKFLATLQAADPAVTGLYGRVWVWAANGTSGWEGALVARRRGGGGGGGGVGLVRVPREPVTIVPATTSGTPLDSEPYVRQHLGLKLSSSTPPISHAPIIKYTRSGDKVTATITLAIVHWQEGNRVETVTVTPQQLRKVYDQYVTELRGAVADGSWDGPVVVPPAADASGGTSKGGVDDLLLALLSAHPTLRAIHGVGSTRDSKSNKTRATVTISMADGSRKTVRRPAGYALGPFTTWGGVPEVLVRWLGLDRTTVQVKGFPTSYRRGRSSFAANGSVVTQRQALPAGLVDVEEPLYLTLNGTATTLLPLSQFVQLSGAKGPADFAAAYQRQHPDLVNVVGVAQGPGGFSEQKPTFQLLLTTAAGRPTLVDVPQQYVTGYKAAYTGLLDRVGAAIKAQVSAGKPLLDLRSLLLGAGGGRSNSSSSSSNSSSSGRGGSIQQMLEALVKGPAPRNTTTNQKPAASSTGASKGTAAGTKATTTSSGSGSSSAST